jgi:hypothetical protein
MGDLILLYTNTISAIIWIVLLDTAGFCARLLIPVFVYFFHFLYPFRKIQDIRSGTSAAAGGCTVFYVIR